MGYLGFVYIVDGKLEYITPTMQTEYNYIKSQAIDAGAYYSQFHTLAVL